MRRLRLAFLILTGTLVGACTTPVKDSQPKQGAVQPAAVPVHIPSLKKEYAQISDLMYRILVGEISGHMGDLKTAVSSYLEAAKISSDPAVSERAVRLASFARDYKSAIKAAERWSELRPDQVNIRHTLAILYLRQGDLEKASGQLEHVLRLSKKARFEGFGRIAALLSREKDKDGAMKLMGKVVSRHPKNSNALFAYASLALQFKQHQIAHEKVKLALKIKPDFAPAKSLYGRVLMVLGKTEEALEISRQLVQQYPNNRSYRVSYARLLSVAGRYDHAMQQFAFILKKSPHDSGVLYAMALLALEKQQYKKSERYFKRLIATGKRKNEAYYYLGNIAETQKRYNSAIRYYANVRHGSYAMRSHLRIAGLLAKKGDVKTARIYLEKLHQRYTNDEARVRFYVAEIDILTKADQLNEAMKVANGALAAYPGNSDLLYARSLLAERMNNLGLAESDLKEVLKKEPNNAHALNALGYTLADRTTRYQEAKVYLEKALKLSPNEPAFLDSMGWLLYKMGKMPDAQKYLERAFKLYDDDEIASHLIEVLWKSGQKDKARKIWKRAVKKHPKSRHLDKVSKWFRK